MKALVAGVFVLAMAAPAGTVVAQTNPATLRWALRLNETRGPIRTADVSRPSGREASSEILGGPTSGSDNAYLIYTRMPSGAHGPALFTLPVEHYYVVLSGNMTVQIGTDMFAAGPMTGVIIPPNTPHEVWNAGAEPEAHLEVIAPATSRDLMSMLKPGLNGQNYTNRDKGSLSQMRLDSTLPGGGGPSTHVHRFEQVYFMVEGTTTVMYGIDKFKASKNDVVILPPGVVHTNANESGAPERHFTLLLPEPLERPFDVEFEMKGPVPPAPTR